VSVSVYAEPTDSVHQLAEFRVGMQACEGGLASQLNEIRVVFPVGWCWQWFADQVPSTAFHGWHTFPDPTSLQHPAVYCQ
jgi:hypothetical protein